MLSFEEYINETRGEAAADYTVYAIPCGKMNVNTGKTKFDWSVFDNGEDSVIVILGYHSDRDNKDKANGAFLYGAASTKDDLKVGDKIVVKDNDSRKKLSGAGAYGKDGSIIVVDIIPATKVEMDKACKKYDYFSREVTSFKNGDVNVVSKKWANLGQVYSIKGIE